MATGTLGASVPAPAPGVHASARTLTAHVAAALAQVGYHADEAGVIAQRLTSRVPEGEDDPASRTELAVKLKKVGFELGASSQHS